ncbi:MAG: extracellular solute-binding protein, partial [Rhodospirillales bacterium]|nr:extracellular solute-binding protein [Rhodospirillales bacterium]
MKRRQLLMAGATLGAASLAAPFVARAAETEITLYNAQHASLAKEWVDGFTRDTGIKVVTRNGGDTAMANQIVQEGASSPADVFLTENSPAMARVEQAGLFAPLPQETLRQVPPQFRPSTGHWIGIAARSTVFAYDKRKLSGNQLPSSLLDLAKPEWKGRWAASPAGADFQAIVAALLLMKGEAVTTDWLKGMKENATAYRGNSAAMKGVNAGEVQGAV